MFERLVSPAAAVFSAASPDALLDELLVELPGAWTLGVLLDVRDQLDTDSAKQKYLVCWERFNSWAQLQRADAVVVASDTQRVVDGPLGVDDFGTDVVALLTNCTKVTAAHEVCIARSLVEDLVGCYSALQRGEISWQMARDVADATEYLTVWQRREVDQAMVDRWDLDMNIKAWRRKLHREVLKVDTNIEERRQRAIKERSVRTWRLADGMAAVHAELPAEGAAAVMAGLTALADKYGQEDREKRAAAKAAQEAAAAEQSGGHEDAADEYDDDWIDPEAFAGLSESRLPEVRTMDQRRADALVDVCSSLLTDPTLPKRQGRRASVQATGGILTLLGLRNDPGELAGYGPITAAHLREIAADADWQRFLTADDTGALIAIGSETYRPKQALRDFLVAKQPTCDFPGCGIPSTRCDGEHTVAHDDGGATDEENMWPRCRRHHRCKTHAGWDVRVLSNGSIQWTTPAGVSRIIAPHRLAGDDTDDPDPPDTG